MLDFTIPATAPRARRVPRCCGSATGATGATAAQRAQRVRRVRLRRPSAPWCGRSRHEDPIVTNSGTAEAAVLDFTIPSGNTGAAGIADVLAANNDTDQATAADTAVTFANTLTTSGTAISHTPGSADVTINTEGVYPRSRQRRRDAGGSPPETLTFTATLNGTDVPGATRFAYLQHGRRRPGYGLFSACPSR